MNLGASLKLCCHDGDLENGFENPFGQFFSGLLICYNQKLKSFAI